MSAIFSCVLAFAQIGVTGVVMDESGEPIPGAAVYISDSTVGTTTDLDGKWQIEVPDNSAQLTFSCIGYEDRKIAVGTRRTFKVVLKESANFIEEAVAVGYGTIGAERRNRKQQGLGNRHPLERPGRRLLLWLIGQSFRRSEQDHQPRRQRS